jgi:hypothetical protein
VGTCIPRYWVLLASEMILLWDCVSEGPYSTVLSMD